MLALAKVSANDVVYDLGSGDGWIPIAAVENYGARAALKAGTKIVSHSFSMGNEWPPEKTENVNGSPKRPVPHG